MKILFLCTAHNSLSQRLYLALSRCHDVTIEYALSEELMISAVALSGPDLVICPFLTTLVPKHIYENYLTLIVHPGPPGDVGPSALDWLLMGDSGSADSAQELLKILDVEEPKPGRTHWGITVLQAIEEFDAGPVWAFEQFPIDIDQPGLTKSELYRGPVTQSVIVATLAAISRIQSAAAVNESENSASNRTITAALRADPTYRLRSVGLMLPWQGGQLHHRPLLKAAQREFDISRHTSKQISRRIRCADSQPGVLSKCFGPSLYVYGGIVEANPDARQPAYLAKVPCQILGVRNEGMCIATCDGKGVWITHIRRPKAKNDAALWPKVPAASGLIALGMLTADDLRSYNWPPPAEWMLSPTETFQEVWIDWDIDDNSNKTCFVHFNFYNGAMATDQCSHLIEALDHIIAQSTPESPVQSVVLMGGSYFSNGIALNVIESASDPATESWLNINRIDDVVHYLLHEFPSRGIITIAAVRGNAAAGGVALAAACDVVIAGSNVVLNPAYRAVGLFGSEYHTLSYYGRCGKANGTKILRSMTPVSSLQAQSIGLVDYVFPGTGEVLDDYIRTHIAYLMKPGILKAGLWKKNSDLSPSALARARTHELGEMSLDFWSARSTRYHSRRFDFVRKVKTSQTPLRFAEHRRAFDDSRRDEEETDNFDSVEHFRKLSEDKLVADLRKKLAAEVSQVFTAPERKMARQEVVVHSIPEVTVGNGNVIEKKLETVFSCYYQPSEDLPTPPESPLSPNEIVDRIAIECTVGL